VTTKLARSFSLCVLALTFATTGSTAQPASDAVVVVHAGRLLDRPGQAPRGASTVLIRNGKVESIREGFLDAASYPGAQVIDLRDKFVLPGLIDAHVHLDSDRAGQKGWSRA
jgi:imidazolonepropionase-like amidohydrolase